VTVLRDHKAGVLAIRVWIEETSPLQLRARITHTCDLDRRDQIISVASTTDEIEDAVSLWLRLFVESSQLTE
jgi:hypothetical protein